MQTAVKKEPSRADGRHRAGAETQLAVQETPREIFLKGHLGTLTRDTELSRFYFE